MSSKQTLEIKGNFNVHPFAELLVEVAYTQLTGSLRASEGSRKTILYLENGRVVYAVSNAKQLRLFSLLLQNKKVEAKVLREIKGFDNDLELSAALRQKGVLTDEDVKAATVSQIGAVIIDVLGWSKGDWVFTPLARVRSELMFDVDLFRILIEYARCVSSQFISQRFKSVNEAFTPADERSEAAVYLLPHERFVYDRFSGNSMTIEELRSVSSMPEAGLLQALYVLWLGGLLERKEWNSAFSATKVGKLLTAKLSLVRKAATLEEPAPVVEIPAPEPVEEPKAKLPELELTLEEYLERVEKAATLYETLGIAVEASLNDIKNSYFGHAKLFHPDRFYRESEATQRRVQLAFTEIAHAYETLRETESRESYDYKMQKDLESKEKRRAAGQAEATTPVERLAEQGLEAFEEGLNMLAEEEYGVAAGYLARAIHCSPQNALYHAYYGKALSASDKHRHKAEGELQTAVKLDPENAQVRLMLVEFFVEMNMVKRAEGELRRFLEIAPNNKEALAMLEELRK